MDSFSASPHYNFPKELLPLRDHLSQCIFHYPVFPNTYSLAFHLGRLACGPKHDAGLVRSCLRRQDHWPHKPAWDKKIELFVADQESLNKLPVTEHIERIKFTSYRLGSILLHRQKVAKCAKLKNKAELDAIKTYDDLVAFIRSTSIKEFYVVTDVQPTAKQFCSDLTQKLGNSKEVRFTIRYYGDRQEADFYDPTPKLYVFGAAILANLATQMSKYCVVDVSDFPTLETYIGARFNTSIKDPVVRDIRGALSSYFDRVFTLAQSVDALHPSNLPHWWRGTSFSYSRAAESARQPDPFHVRPRRARSTDDIEYLRILKQHHYAPSTGACQQ